MTANVGNDHRLKFYAHRCDKEKVNIQALPQNDNSVAPSAHRDLAGCGARIGTAENEEEGRERRKKKAKNLHHASLRGCIVHIFIKMRRGKERKSIIKKIHRHHKYLHLRRAPPAHIDNA